MSTSSRHSFCQQHGRCPLGLLRDESVCGPPSGMLMMQHFRLQAAGDFTSAVILPVDIEDVGDAYNFVADVPGLEKGDIKVCIFQRPTS